MPVRYPDPIKTYKIINSPVDSSYPDPNRSDIQLNAASISIPGIGNFKNGDTFTLYGAAAVEFSKVAANLPVILIANPSPPVVNFSCSVTSGDVPLTVTFTDLSTNNPTEWFWNFDADGGYESNLQNPTFTFNQGGIWEVTLIASNKGGVGVATQTITVGDIAPPAPVANLTANATTGTYPVSINFTDLSTNTPTSWLWDFGDGNTSTSQNPSHTYTADGNYTVALTATNSSGSNITSKINYITISAPVMSASVFGATGTSGTFTVPNPNGQFTSGATIDLSNARLYYRENTHWRKIAAEIPTVGSGVLNIPFTVLGAPIPDDLTLSLTVPSGAITQGAASSLSISGRPVTNNSTRKVYNILNVKPTVSFKGNQYRTITAIDVSGGITYGRSTIVEGQAIHASASAITATGTSNPYRDLEFRWLCEIAIVDSPDVNTDSDWETPTQVEMFTCPVFGGNWNPYTDQEGGEFVIPADYGVNHRITLTCRGKNGGGFTTATTKSVVTVTPFTAASDLWISATGNNSNDGLDPLGLSLTGASFTGNTKTITKVGAFATYDQTAATALSFPYHDYNKISLTSTTINYTPETTPVYWFKPEDLPTTGSTLTSWTNRGSGGAISITGTWTTATGTNGFLSIATGTNQLVFPDFAYSSITVLCFARSDNTRPGITHSNVSNFTRAWELSVGRTSSTAFIDSAGSMINDGTNAEDSNSITANLGNGSYFMVGFTFSSTSLSTHENYVTTNKTTAVTTLYNPSGTIVVNPANLAGTSYLEFVILPNALNNTELTQWEGYFAWKYGQTGALPSGHTYKSVAPWSNLLGVYEISSKTSNDAVVINTSVSTDIAAVTSSNGPKDTSTLNQADNQRRRIKSGDTINSQIPAYVSNTSGTTSNQWTHAYGSDKFIGTGIVGSLGSSSWANISGVTLQDFICDSNGNSNFVGITGAGLNGDAASWVMLRNFQYRNNILDFANGEVLSTAGDGAVIWNADFDATQATGGGLRSIGTIGNAMGGSWAAQVGIHRVTNADDTIFAHHVYPNQGSHHLYALLSFGEGGNASYNMNCDAGSSVSETVSQYKLIKRVQFCNAVYGNDLSSHGNTRHAQGGTDNPHRDVVIEDCTYHHLTGMASFYSICDSVVWRNNCFWNIASSIITNNDTAGLLEFYDNKIYRASTDTGACIVFSSSNANQTKAHYIRGNIVHDMRTQPTFLQCNFTRFAQSVSNGAVVTGNVIYAPNRSSDAVIYDSVSASYKTPAQFEAAVGLSAGTITFTNTPPFADPANGNFS